MFSCRVAYGCYVLGGIHVGLGKAVGNGFESKGREAVERVGTSGFEKAFVVELSVNKSDMKASVVEDFGHLEHGVYVALSWERDTNCMGLLYYGRGTHIFVSH
jgi:hypothetical protein